MSLTADPAAPARHSGHRGWWRVLLACGVLVAIVGALAARRPFLKADLLWHVVGGATGWYENHLLLPRMRIEAGTPDRHTELSVERDVAVAMRDGVILRHNQFRPAADGRYPTILIRLPYGKDEYYCYMPAIGDFWARKGYACVTQDVRGKWASDGIFEPFEHEVEDGYDTIDWIARQPWSNGTVGVMGESYYGYTTWAAAVCGHPALAAFSPSTFAPDVYTTTFRQGALNLQAMAIWALLMDGQTYQNVLRVDSATLPLMAMGARAGLHDTIWQSGTGHQTRDAFWDAPRGLHQRYADVTVPGLHLGGWYDNFQPGTFDGWRGVQARSADANARSNQWLLLGPWDHEYTTDKSHRIGRLEIGENASTTRWDTLQAFFDHFLMGIDNGFETRPKIQYFTIGPNQWRTTNVWPVAEIAPTAYYLLPGKTLNTTPPVAESTDTFRYDPLDPVAISASETMWDRALTLTDRASLARRPDVLVYDSAPLDAHLEITGPITVTLYAASSAVDTDFTATLVDLFPDGYAHLVQEGVVRASFRESDTNPTPIVPGRVYEYTIDLWATSYVIPTGHRIRVEISSSNFDRFDRNLNAGAPFAVSSETMTAVQTVHHSPRYPSHITLPVVPGGEPAASRRTDNATRPNAGEAT